MVAAVRQTRQFLGVGLLGLPPPPKLLVSGQLKKLYRWLLIAHCCCFPSENFMAQRSVSREDFRGLFALYACAAQLNKKHDGASRLLNLFDSSRDISDDLLHLWSERVEAVSAETVGSVLCPRARAV